MCMSTRALPALRVVAAAWERFGSLTGAVRVELDEELVVALPQPAATMTWQV